MSKPYPFYNLATIKIFVNSINWSLIAKVFDKHSQRFKIHHLS